jgi:hypothetical protein
MVSELAMLVELVGGGVLGNLDPAVPFLGGRHAVKRSVSGVHGA